MITNNEFSDYLQKRRNKLVIPLANWQNATITKICAIMVAWWKWWG